MSHQRYPSHDAVKEPHMVSLKVLRLSRPSLVAQYPLQPPPSRSTAHHRPPPIPASLAYSPDAADNGSTTSHHSSNPSPFILSPIVNLPPSFGSAYVGETFSCTLCANHDITPLVPSDGLTKTTNLLPTTPQVSKTIRDVRIEAEMKTPNSPTVTRLALHPDEQKPAADTLAPGETLQRVVNFDLKEEGNHVLAVTVSYYEATDVSGRVRTFRKLYQFICKASLVVRTKPGPLTVGSKGARRWVLEAQLENCSEDAMQLERVGLEVERGLVYRDCNSWGSTGGKPVLHPGEVEQVCFVVEEEKDGEDGGVEETDGKVVFGVLGIGWRTEMGNRGFLSTGKLGTRHVKPKVAVS
ncbi:hypothetical protein B0T19DRAFT_403731 [Cercophora scortea]|uniref:Trafficking protein particle complex subunit 13 n=1 Tax=Cercophora scortea TaxID=314031 RepID=A0AAE0IBC0_9PEZI|nr:hypothetical protein B0T19DRAFT_403731 [Cercophora scortea]